MSVRTDKIAFLLHEFLDIPGQVIEQGLVGDQGLFRSDAFTTRFATGSPDPHGTNGAARIRRLLTQMCFAHAVTKVRVGHPVEDCGDHPGWQYHWRLDKDIAERLFDQTSTVEKEALVIDEAIRTNTRVNTVRLMHIIDERFPDP